MNKLAAIPIENYFQTSFGSGKGFGDLVSVILSNAIVLSGVILLFLIVLGGIGIIHGAGSQKPDQVAKGQQTVTMAIIGFIIIFASYWIIKIVEVVSGFEILKPGF